jgi:hypothetical protein
MCGRYLAGQVRRVPRQKAQFSLLCLLFLLLLLLGLSINVYADSIGVSYIKHMFYYVYTDYDKLKGGDTFQKPSFKAIVVPPPPRPSPTALASKQHTDHVSPTKAETASDAVQAKKTRGLQRRATIRQLHSMDLILVSTLDGTIHALKRSTGERLWTQDQLGGALVATHFRQNGLIHHDEKNDYEIDEEDGEDIDGDGDQECDGVVSDVEHIEHNHSHQISRGNVMTLNAVNINTKDHMVSSTLDTDKSLGHHQSTLDNKYVEEDVSVHTGESSAVETRIDQTAIAPEEMIYIPEPISGGALYAYIAGYGLQASSHIVVGNRVCSPNRIYRDYPIRLKNWWQLRLA